MRHVWYWFETVFFLTLITFVAWCTYCAVVQAGTVQLKDSTADYQATVFPDGSIKATLIYGGPGLVVNSPLNLGVVGSVAVLSINQASSTASGYLSEADWDTFDAKQDALLPGAAINFSSSDVNVQYTNSIALCGNSLCLQGDESSVPASSYYGTGSTGGLGYQSLPTGIVNSVAVATTNGFEGTVTGISNVTINLATTVSGLIKGVGNALVAAVAGTDYQAPISSATAPANKVMTSFTAPNTFGFSGLTTSYIPSLAGLYCSLTGCDYTGNIGFNNPTPTAVISNQNVLTSQSGTLSSVGTAVTGVGTSFTSVLHVNDQVVASGQSCLVTAISSNTAFTCDVAFSPVLSSATWSNEPSMYVSYDADQSRFTSFDGYGNLDIGGGVGVVAGNNANVITANHTSSGFAGTYFQFTHGTRVGRVGVDPSNGVTFQRTDSTPTGGFGIDSSGNTFPVGGTWGKSTSRWTVGYFNTLNVVPSAVGNNGIVVEALGSQTADLQQWQNSSAVKVTGIQASGLLQIVPQGSGVTPTCSGSQSGVLALTSAYVLCVCNTSGWVRAADGSTSCTF